MSLHLGEKTEDGFIQKKFRVIGMQDEDQFFDQVELEEIPTDVVEPTKQVFEYRNIKINTFIFS